jgi:hypothetical protein
MYKKILQASILFIISSYCVYSSLEYFRSSFTPQSRDETNRRFEDRLEDLRQFIPLERGVIGYLSNEDIETAEYTPGNASGEYVLAQYALSPLILDRGEYHEWNILNMTSDAFKIWDEKYGHDFQLIKSGGGFYLIQRLSK